MRFNIALLGIGSALAQVDHSIARCLSICSIGLSLIYAIEDSVDRIIQSINNRNTP